MHRCTPIINVLLLSALVLSVALAGCKGKSDSNIFEKIDFTLPLADIQISGDTVVRSNTRNTTLSPN